MNKIITVGREFGSGGREFARKLAEKLSYEYFDKEIVTEISKHTALSEEYVKNIIEQKPHHLYPITVGQTLYYPGNYHLSQQQKVLSAQTEIIKNLAVKSPCVIVGRCADFILTNFSPYKIFIYADMNSKINRCRERNAEQTSSMSDKELSKAIKSIDKNRAKYYYYFTGNKWGDKNNYNLMINTSNLSIDKCVDAVIKMLQTNE